MRETPYKRLTEEERIKRREISKQRKESPDYKIRKYNTTPEFKEKRKLNERLYRLNFKEEYNKDRRYRYNIKKQNNPFYILDCNIRSLILGSIKRKGFIKKNRTEEILGCTINEFIIYLESQFEPWMNWNNYGNWNGIPTELNTAWDIDHIIPTSSAMSEEEVYKLNHFTNLKPLCSYVNRYIKSDIMNFYIDTFNDRTDDVF